MLSKLQLFLFVFLFSTILSSIEVKAQAGKLPPFRILQTNGNVFKAEQLPLGKPIIVVYFSPDCHECQFFMDKLFPKIKNFQSASLALITDLSINEVIKFSDKYKIKNYKNIVVGTEGGNYFIGNYYHVSEMPFVALYDKNGNFISSYQKNIPIDELATKLSKLK